MKSIMSFGRLLSLIGLVLLPWPALADSPIIVGDGTAASCTQAALENALAVAATDGGGTIRFACGEAPVTITLDRPDPTFPARLSFPNNTRIDGDGLITLDASYRLALFVEHDTNVVLKDLTITHGRPVGLINEGTLIVKNSTISQNSYQGAISNSGKLTITHSSVSDNISGGFASSAAITNTGTLTVKHSMVSGNSDNAIVNEPSGTLTVLHSAFFDNSGDAGQGAIKSRGTAAIRSSMFGRNRNGGISNGGMLTITGSVFFGNGLGQAFAGGAAISNGGTLTVSNSAFFGNHAGGGGGAITNRGTLTIYESELSGNSSNRVGGAIYNDGTFNETTLSIYNSEITENTARTDGGGIYSCCGGSLTLENTFVEGNTPNNIVTVP